jgi:hypothetical protein
MPAHTCCAWCQPPEHTLTTLVPANVATVEEFLTRFGGLPAQRAGMEILGARPAPEADRDTVIAEMQARGARAYHRNGAVNPDPDYWHDYRVWVLTYREI